MKLLKQLLRNKKGAALVEYGLLVAGVALVTAAAVSIFGHKTNDLLATTAGILPGVNAADNGPIASGRLIETAENNQYPNQLGQDAIGIDVTGILTQGNGTARLGNNLGMQNVGEMVVDTQQ